LQEKEKIHFDLLKQKVVAMMQQSYPGINPSIEDWKGQEITDFQEDLRIKVNATISEKWFYTHMKSSQGTIPRIDVLNFLSKYAGYANWDDFIYNNKPVIPSIRNAKKANRLFILVPVLAAVILGTLFGIFKLFNTQEYRFTFVDADTHEPISSGKIEVILLQDGESPAHFLADSNGCFLLKTDKSKIQMVVNLPCYLTDTIVRIVKKMNRDELIMLKPDDYALMIHYFSTMKVDDWEKRRDRLREMINEDAMICQLISEKDNTGMAIYNKQEFIDKLTMPSGSLKNIEILGSQFIDGKLVVLRFRIKEKKI